MVMELDLKTIFAFCGGALGVIAFVGQLKAFFSSGEKQLGKDIAELKLLLKDGNSEIAAQLAAVNTRLADHDRRVQSLESDMKQVPDREAIHRLEINFEKLAGQVGLMYERMAPIASTTRRLQDFLLEKATD
jgi:hypothetical protein